MTDEQWVIAWREVITLDRQWRDAFFLAMEQIGQSWSLRPAGSDDGASEMMILAYPASSHDAIVAEPEPLGCIERLPTLAPKGTLVLMACGRSSPEVSVSEVADLSSIHLIAQYAVGENIRAMRLPMPASEEIAEMIANHMRQVQLSGVNLARVVTDVFGSDSTDATTLSDVDTADL